jgi:hypothetical protein
MEKLGKLVKRQIQKTIRTRKKLAAQLGQARKFFD